MKKQKKITTSTPDQTNSSAQTVPTTTISNSHHTIAINNLASLNLNNLNNLNHVPQFSLQPRTDSIIDHSVDQNYLNSNFLLGLSNRSLLNLNSLNAAAANNFNVSKNPQFVQRKTEINSMTNLASLHFSSIRFKFTIQSKNDTTKSILRCSLN